MKSVAVIVMFETVQNLQMLRFFSGKQSFLEVLTNSWHILCGKLLMNFVVWDSIDNQIDCHDHENTATHVINLFWKILLRFDFKSLRVIILILAQFLCPCFDETHLLRSVACQRVQPCQAFIFDVNHNQKPMTATYDRNENS